MTLAILANSSRSMLWLAGIALCLAVSGCSTDVETSPAELVAASGDTQCGAPGTLLEKPLVVRVLGPSQLDFLGRKAGRAPVADVTVTFRVEEPAEGQPPTDDAPDSAGDGGPRKSLAPGADDGQGTQVTGWSGAELRHPVVLDPITRKPGPDPRELSVATDAAGFAKVLVHLGSVNGDWRVEAEVRRRARSRLKEHFRMVCGVIKIEEETEAVVGQKVPLRLQLAGRERGAIVPLPGRDVFFAVVGEPHGTGEPAKLTNRKDATDERGERRAADLTLGDVPGVYTVLAEVEPFGDDRPIRGILYRIVAMDWYRIGLAAAGGSLLFLLGVRFLGNGFLLVLSTKLHLATSSLAENRAMGYFGGLLAGAVFESSTTVHSYLASFANGGLLSASGALGMLLGACLGATALPQILTLGLDFLVAPLLGAGLCCFVLPRRAHMLSWGWVFLGTGLVFASWTTLSTGVDLLSLSERFRAQILPGDVDPAGPYARLVSLSMVYFGGGAALGFVLRSSNLVVLGAILLAAGSVSSPASAIPLILGANLGAALMTFARSLFKLREARRVGLLCLAVHAASTLVFITLSLVPAGDSSLLVGIVDWTAPGNLTSAVPENVAHHLAMAHTLYNLAGSFVFLLLPQPLLAVVDRLLPSRRTGDIKPYHLDENLVTVPALALRQATEEAAYMAQLCQKTVAEAFDSFRYGDIKLSDQVVRREEVISGLHRDLSRYLVLVAENQLSRHDASRLEILQSAASSLGRIGELGEQLRDLTNRRVEEKFAPAAEIDRDLAEVYDLVLAQFDNILTLLKERSSRVEENAVKLVERLAKYRSRLEAQWQQRLDQGHATGEGAREGAALVVPLQLLVYQEAFDVLFRVAAHLAHIAQRMRILSPERL